MTDKMMLASMFVASATLIAALFLCSALLRRRRIRRERASLRSLPEIPQSIYEQDAYETRYIYASPATFSSGKTIRIRPEYYARLHEITTLTGRGNLSLIVYLDRVLQAHFEDNGPFIERFQSKCGSFKHPRR